MRLPARGHERSRAALALLFVTTGVLHFVVPDAYARIVPPVFPHAPWLVAGSGVAEIAGGIGVLWAPVRRIAGWGLIALLIAVFPANVQMLRLAIADHAHPLWQAALWARLPVQGLLIWWVWRVAARPAPAATSR